MLAALTAAAAGDEILLADGRTLTGTVTLDGDSLVLEMDYGTVRFPREDVVRIDYRDTPAQTLLRKLSEVRHDDGEALFTVADWAAQNGMTQQAQELCAEVVRRVPDHAGARKLLRQTKIEGQWLGFRDALQKAEAMLQAGQCNELLLTVLPALQQIQDTDNASQARAMAKLKAEALLRAGRFPAAAAAFAELARDAQGLEAVRYAATAEILSANSDGMYVVTQAYPPGSALLSEAAVQLKPGPASLASPAVIQAALLDKARKEIEQAEALLAGAAPGGGDPMTPLKREQLAVKAWDRADALAPGLSHSYRVQLARGKIASARVAAATAARQFDEDLSRLGQAELSPGEYRAVLAGMIRQLEKVEELLQGAQELARPFPRDLVLEIQWMDSDLKRIQETKQELTAELHANS